jgi:hypothetical protein
MGNTIFSPKHAAATFLLQEDYARLNFAATGALPMRNIQLEVRLQF